MSRVTLMRVLLFAASCICLGCAASDSGPTKKESSLPEPEFFLDTARTHNKFSRSIPAVLTVPSGSVIEVKTKEATDGQLGLDSTAADIPGVSIDPIHPLTGPIAVEGAMPGDTLAVTILDVRLGSWGWVGVFPGFGFLAEEFTEPYLETYRLDERQTELRMHDGRVIPLRPFAGVMGVAPETSELLSTIPPRANGGNMDNPALTVGSRIYFPVFVEGANFSIGDTHAAQGMGEVCGTGLEAPMTILLRLELLRGGRRLAEPEYETTADYATTASAPSLDEAARQATRYMIEYLVQEHGMDRTAAYALCSLAGRLEIAEVVDVPHMHVAMHMPKHVLKREP